MKILFISILLIVLISCNNSKNLVQENIENPQSIHKSMTRSKSLESQHELAVLMRSWTQEQRDDFKRKYVHSEINIFLKNGDTLQIK
jgi:LAS superfamily LD-carboxypeptidase LdcB